MHTVDVNGLGDLGFGWKSIGRGIKKVGKAAVVNPTKFVVQKTVVAPTKIAAKSAVGVTKASVAVGTNVARGNVKGAFKAATRVALAPAQLTVALTKDAAKTGLALSKAITNIALRPVRSRLNTIKNRRAKKLAWDNRKSAVPTVAENAQARKDTKSWLSSKGPHGKILSFLAGSPMMAGELGVVGYDDAAIAAIATALVATASKLITDAAKGKFAPADAAKEGAGAGLTTGVQTALPTAKVAMQNFAPRTSAAVATAVQAKRDVEQAAQEDAAEVAANEAATQEEVAAEPAAQAEEAATDAETAATEEALEGAGLLRGFLAGADVAVAPASMDETVARRIASTAQRMVCQMSAPALAAIGGMEAVNAAGTLCRAVAAGDEATVRAVLPSVVQIAARAAGDMTIRALPMGVQRAGGLPNEGFGGVPTELWVGASAKKKKSFKLCVKAQMQELEASRDDAEYSCQDELRGISPDDMGMLAALDGADPEGLAFGLAGVIPEDLSATEAATAIPTSMLVASGLVALAGFWMAFKDNPSR